WAGLGTRASDQTTAFCTFTVLPRTVAAITCSWFWSQSSARNRAKGSISSVVSPPARLLYRRSPRSPDRRPGLVLIVLVPPDVEALAQLADVAPVDDPRPAHVGVDDGLDARHRPALVEVADRLEAVDLRACRQVLVQLLHRGDRHVRLGDQPRQR